MFSRLFYLHSSSVMPCYSVSHFLDEKIESVSSASCTHSAIPIQFSSVTQSRLTLCDPMNHSTPGLHVHHQLPESTQTHVHWVGDAIQPSHPLLSPSPPALIFPSIRVFSNESALRIRWPKYWSFSFNISLSNEHPGLISFRMDWLDLLAIHGTLKSFYCAVIYAITAICWGENDEYFNLCLLKNHDLIRKWLNRLGLL